MHHHHQHQTIAYNKPSFLNNLQQIAKYYLIACCLFIISVLLVQYYDTSHVVYIKELKFLSNPSSNVEISKQQEDNQALNLGKNIIPPTKDIIKTYTNRKYVQWSNIFQSKDMPKLTCDSYHSSSHVVVPIQTQNSTNQTSTKPLAELCDKEYGCGLLSIWKEHSYLMCEEIPSTTFQRLRKYVMGSVERYPTTMNCYSYNNTHLPVATSPHTVCDASNLVMDFSKLIHAPCLKYRPGYFCKKPTYFNYNESALIGNCRRTSDFKLSLFSNDFGKDIFSSFRTIEEMHMKEQPEMQYFDGVTIFVSREQDEHVNMFHSMTDFFATYVMIEMFQLNSSHIQIVLLDDHYDGPFDFLWNSVFSLKRPMMKASQFNNSTVRFERAIFQHSGYATQMLSNILDFNRLNAKFCSSKVELISGFSKRIMHALGVIPRIPKKSALIKVLFITRKPYVKNGINHKYMARQISNEQEVISKLQNDTQINSTFIIEKIDFAEFTLSQQIQKVNDADVLIGYHGAGLTHTLWLPEGTSATIEIWKTIRIRSWRCFEQLSYWKGNVYELWSNSEPRTVRVDKTGDYLRVNPETFKKTFSHVISSLISIRNKTLS